MPSPLSHLATLGAEEIEKILKGDNPHLKIAAVRTIAWVEAVHERTELMRARTDAYIKRCEVLNERTTSGASRTAHSALRQSSDDWVPTKGDPRNKKPFGAPLSPGDTDPHTGWVVPEEHICQTPKSAPENHVIGFCMLPGYKTKADLERAVATFIDRDNRIYNELKAAQSELNVFRSERLGSITLEKREELLAGRFEKNNKRRQTYGTPTFLAELKQLTPELLNATPIPPLEELFPVPTSTNSPHSLPFPTGEMSRGSTSDREGVSPSPNEERSRRAGREAVSRPQHLSPPSASASQPTSPPPSSAPSAVKEVLSEKAAARRAAGKHPLPPLTPRLNHPPPSSRSAKPP